MSTDDPISLKQDRRQWLKTSATVLGASLLPLPAAAQTGTAPAAPQAKPGETKSTARFFTPAQHTLVEELSETIIPADSHSGGAKAAKVADYIEQVLRESLDDTQKALWREGLRLVDLMSRHYHGKSFVDSSPEERVAILTVLSDNERMTDLPEVRLFIELKRLTVRGYYTSKIGIHGEAMADGRVKVGIIGSQFQADIHAASFQIMPHEAEVVAIASPTPGNAAALAKRFGIPRVFTDYREMLKERDIEMITIAAPNSLHVQMTKDIAAAGKHIVCEKPLAMTIAEGEEMIAAAKQHGVLLMYGEELFFTPKYLKAKEMADAGAFGKVYLVKQSEKHFGPHSPWFWDMNRSGGGAFMDLGCHGIAFCYFFLGRSPIKSVYCQMGTYVHHDKTKAEDDSLCILEFANGAVGLIENSWARRGGMDDRIEVFGEAGMTYANLHMGNALPTFSENGYGYAVEKAPTTKGWTYPVFEELWNYGTPQELAHFARCARGRETPQATGEDGLVVMHALYAGYASAGEGRKISMPYQPPPGVKKPIDLWLDGPARRQTAAR